MATLPPAADETLLLIIADYLRHAAAAASAATAPLIRCHYATCYRRLCLRHCYAAIAIIYCLPRCRLPLPDCREPRDASRRLLDFRHCRHAMPMPLKPPASAMLLAFRHRHAITFATTSGTHSALRHYCRYAFTLTLIDIDVCRCCYTSYAATPCRRRRFCRLDYVTDYARFMFYALSLRAYAILPVVLLRCFAHAY